MLGKNFLIGGFGVIKEREGFLKEVRLTLKESAVTYTRGQTRFQVQRKPCAEVPRSGEHVGMRAGAGYGKVPDQTALGGLV